MTTTAPITTTGPMTTREQSRRLMDRWWRELTEADERGTPVANVFVMGSLAEILRSFDIPMSFPEIAALQAAIRHQSQEHLLTAEDYGYSPDICGYVKVDVGMHLSGRDHPAGKLPKPGLVIAANTCNTYIKWAEFWERMYGCPVFTFDLPGWRGTGFTEGPAGDSFDADRRYVEGQLRELITLCEAITGKTFDIDRLRQVMAEVNRLSDGYQALLALNKNHPAPFDALREGVVYMGIANAFRGDPGGADFMELAGAELAGRVAAGEGASPEERFRLIFTGPACYSDFRNFMTLFADWGSTFVHSEYMSYAGGGIDRGIHYELEHPIESMAEQLLISGQRAFSGIFHSQSWLAEIAREWSADGICFHGVKSCRTTSTGLPDARELLARREDVPGLFIQSDLVDTRLFQQAQLKNRVDAFFESLQSRRDAERR